MELMAEGNINAPVRPTPVALPEYLLNVQQALVRFFDAGYNAHFRASDNTDSLTFLNKTLKENNAVIAGGFLLNAIHNYVRPGVYETVDIDIYVPCKNLKRLNKTMAKLTSSGRLTQHNATSYCLSFLRRNGIRSVQTFYPSNDQRDPIRYSVPSIMDIMAVRNTRSPLDVVQNFDLTFCQIWYDGETLWVTHPSDVKNKKGVLQNDYVALFLQGNIFLKNRIRKYARRGFIVRTNTSNFNLSEVAGNNSFYANYCPSVPHDEAFYKQWLTRVLFKLIFYNTYTVRTPNITNNTNIAVNTEVSKRRPSIEKTIAADMNPDDETSLEETDGYDSDEYTIDRPELFYPLLTEKVYVPRRVSDAHRDAWLAQPVETRYLKCMKELVTLFYSIVKESRVGIYNNIIFGSRFYNSREGIREVSNDVYDVLKNDQTGGFHGSGFFKYGQTLDRNGFRLATDALTLDDGPVYDLHNHTLDEAIGVDSLKAFLEPLRSQSDKNNLPCYVTGCEWGLSLDELRSILDKDWYLSFTGPIRAPLPPPDPLLGTQGLGDNPGDAETRLELIDIVKNAPGDAGGWRNIYHHVMCPFCLTYISRDAGCTYVTHPNPDNLPISFSPYCKPQNIVQSVRDKYRNYPNLEVCAECGRPCSSHRHFDLNDPPGFAPIPRTAAGNPDYARCGGGGRREALARIIAVRKYLVQYASSSPETLRRICASGAEAGANITSFLAKADAVLAKNKDDRVETNLDFATAGGKRLGRVCSHGHGSYKNKIPMTRKTGVKKTKKTRKN